MKLIRNQKPKTIEKELQTQSAPSAVKRKNQFVDNSSIPSASVNHQSAWQILVVDDEPEVHAVTKLSVGNLRFSDKPIRLLKAMSAAEAKVIFAHEHNIAVALIDVVMETEDAGLRLVDYIRNELENKRIRIIIRTGHPGVAPERQVIDHYDIDDYKEKTELTQQRLYTTLRSALKAYHDISVIEKNRQGLEQILTAAPEIYRIQPMELFIQGVLTQITGLCHLGSDNLFKTLDGVLIISDNESKRVVQAGTGLFANNNTPEVNALIEKCEAIIQHQQTADTLPEASMLLPLIAYDKTLGFIYCNDIGLLTEDDHTMLKIMVAQCAVALENLQLYTDLENANQINEHKNYFLGMTAHDLRNPTGIIKGYADLLSLQIKKSSEKTENMDMFIDEIKNSCDFMLELVNNLLDISTIEAGKLDLKLEFTDIIATISRTTSLNYSLAETKQIQLTFIADNDIPKIKMDEKRIHQVITNLLSNAIKYSYPNTKVQVQLRNTDKEVIISVSDQGQGIPANELDQLFKPFSKTSVVGTGNETSTGLGLLICRQIVEAHQGKIWLESTVNVGSTFFISLPISTVQ